jgi:hypothetical protein
MTATDAVAALAMVAAVATRGFTYTARSVPAFGKARPGKAPLLPARLSPPSPPQRALAKRCSGDPPAETAADGHGRGQAVSGVRCALAIAAVASVFCNGVGQESSPAER